MIDTNNRRQTKKERDRRKQKMRRYGQSRLKHSKKGIVSIAVALGAWGLFVALIVVSVMKKGNASALVGSFAILALLIGVVGFLSGIRGFRERERNYLTCKIGVGINGLLILVLLAVFIRGIL